MTVEPLRTVRTDRVAMKSIVWLDKPLLQGSAFHLVAGPKGVGKGTWLARMVANMTRGAYGEPRNALMVSSEDSLAIDLTPRLAAAGADLARAHAVVDDLTLPADLHRLRDLAMQIEDVGLIVIDPVGNHLGGADTDKEGAVRNGIKGLNHLSDELACSILGVRHIGKNRQNGSLASVLGSTAWVDTPRAVLMFAADDEDEMVFHVQVVAGNRSGRSAAESYRLELRQVEGLTEPVTYAAALGQSAKHVDDLLAITPTRGAKRSTAKDLILRELSTGAKPLDQLKALAAAEIGCSGETVWRAASELKANGKAKSRNTGPGTPWLWHLTDNDPDFVNATLEAA